MHTRNKQMMSFRSVGAGVVAVMMVGDVITIMIVAVAMVPRPCEPFFPPFILQIQCHHPSTSCLSTTAANFMGPDQQRHRMKMFLLSFYASIVIIMIPAHPCTTFAYISYQMLIIIILFGVVTKL